ncbi:UDP-2,3-diacylglucosamine diphosphatase [Cupriavidus respiraculi]|uniref:UDP-2,3-diacylglucosamine diphosphatase n=1 Tax=Cupriavidus respiraculi TaxID=195930 RepID=UPI001C956CB7|nr:UDP-2,3-diacylglucosamine diphosphatase [Cupriavidus respiraculi]MBY4945475.1 UDP-2,3-diacylglucosamine diphosphatase [Cupriavidus respiraculi]
MSAGGNTLPADVPAVHEVQVPAPAWFVSDLHLTPGMPRTLAAFEQLLDRAAREARTLFILGDFFEFWVGDEETAAPFPARVAATLARLSAAGVHIYLMHGNRDFLLGERFARAAGATLLPDPTVIRCAGERVVLTHGDMLCTDDVGYMRFRNWTRKRWVQRLFLALPMPVRLAVARKLRGDSEAGRARPVPADYGDVSPTAVRALLRDTGTTVMIHGHTHRPARHETETGVRWVLTDWDLDGRKPRAAALRLDAHGLSTIDAAVPD